LPFSLISHFSTKDDGLDTHWTVGWVGCREGLNVIAKKKKSMNLSGIKSRSPIP